MPGQTESVWLQHKESILGYYITQDMTLKETMKAMETTHQFCAREWQYKSKLGAWGIIKNLRYDACLDIEGTLRRRNIHIDEVESVELPMGSVKRSLSGKNLKRRIRRCQATANQSEHEDRLSSPVNVHFQLQYAATRTRAFDIELPFLDFVAEISNELRRGRTLFNFSLAADERVQNSTNNQAPARLESHSWEHIVQGLLTMFTGYQDYELLWAVRELVPSVIVEACASTSKPWSRTLDHALQAMFLLFNNLLGINQARPIHRWLARNVNLTNFLQLKSTTAKHLTAHILHGAVEANRIDLLQLVHDRGENLEWCSFDNTGLSRSLLQCAIEFHHPVAAEFLIKCNATTEPKTVCEGCDSEFLEVEHLPLALACESPQCVNLLPLLLAHGATLSGRNLLAKAIKAGGSLEAIRALIYNGAIPGERFIPSTTEESPLGIATAMGRTDVMELLLSYNVSPHGLSFAHLTRLKEAIESGTSQTRELASPPLIGACRLGNLGAVDMLLRSGAFLNYSPVHIAGSAVRLEEVDRFSSISHPIQAAARNGNVDFVDCLVARGAGVNTCHGMPPLVIAAWFSDFAMVRYLLTKGADINAMWVEVNRGYSALCLAAARGDIPMMKMLLKAGADINLRSSRPGSRTPLQMAGELNEREAVRFLVSAGASTQPQFPRNGDLSTLEILVLSLNVDELAHAISRESVLSTADHGSAMLLRAVLRGEPAVVSYLIQLGADADRCLGRCMNHFGAQHQPRCAYPMLLAAKVGNLDICRILTEAGANVDGPEGCNAAETPLSVAVNAGNFSLAQYLLLEAGASHVYGPTVLLEDTPLYIAIKDGNEGMVRLVLGTGASAHTFHNNADRNIRTRSCPSGGKPGNDHITPLVLASEYGHVKIVQLLIRNGADVNARCCLTDYTPLLVACILGEFGVAKTLLEHDADVNAICTADCSTVTALQTAAEDGDNELVTLLVGRGANITAPAIGRLGLTALQAASKNGSIPMVQYFLEHGARVNEPSSEEGKTAIQWAAEYGRLDVLKLLLHHYIGPESVIELCEDAVAFARRRCHAHVLEFLQQYKELSRTTTEKELAVTGPEETGPTEMNRRRTEHAEMGPADMDLAALEEWIDWDLLC